MRHYFARCVPCGWMTILGTVTTMQDARGVADAHDRTDHKKRPISSFGYCTSKEVYSQTVVLTQHAHARPQGQQ